MLKRFINFMRNDYRSVSGALRELSNNRIPTAVIVLYYCVLAPIGLLLYFPVKWFSNYCIRKLLKDIDKGA